MEIHTDNRTQAQQTSKIAKFANGFEKIVPDSLTVAFILLVIVGILAVVFAGAPIFISTESHQSVADSMAGSFWNLLTFSMQMCLVSILGNIFAMSPPYAGGSNESAASQEVPWGPISSVRQWALFSPSSTGPSV